MYLKWNPNLAFPKSECKMIMFSHFWQCAWWEKCIFALFFLILLPRVFTVTIFHVIFSFPFVCSFAKYMTMSWKWPKNGYCEQPYWFRLLTCTSCTISSTNGLLLCMAYLSSVLFKGNAGRFQWSHFHVVG